MTLSKKTKDNKKRSFSMPTAFTIIIGIMLIFIVLSWILYGAGVKTQVYQDGRFIEKRLVGLGILDIFTAVWHGFVSKAEIIAFILCIGGILGLMTRTKAIDAAIGHVVAKLKGKEIIIIPILMTIFGLGGTSYGMWEETVAFFPILIPVFKRAGYGSITAVFVILLGAGAGNLASTVNPFATGIAFESAKSVISEDKLQQVTQQSIMFGTRWIVFFIYLTIAIVFVSLFATKIKNGKIKIAGIDEAAIQRDFMKNEGNIDFTLKRKITITIFILGFVFMILSYLPWTQWLQESHPLALKHADINYNRFLFFIASTHGQWAPWGSWYLISVSAIFLVIGLLVFAINRNDFVEKNTTKEQVFISTFVDGSKDVLSVCLLIATAAGLGSILDKTLIGPWIANSAQSLGQAGLLVFGLVIFFLSLILSFLLPSTSGFAGAFIPIFASIAARAFGNDIEQYKSAIGLIMFAFIIAEGVINICSPTSAALMAYTKLSHVPFNVWIKYSWKLIVTFLILGFVLMLIFGGIAQAGITLI